VRLSLNATARTAGAVVKTPLTTPDILPSLLGLANIEIPKCVDDENLSNLVKSYTSG